MSLRTIKDRAILETSGFESGSLTEVSRFVPFDDSFIALLVKCLFGSCTTFFYRESLSLFDGFSDIIICISTFPDDSVFHSKLNQNDLIEIKRRLKQHSRREKLKSISDSRILYRKS